MVSNRAETDGKSAVVVGGGIGGLTAAVALRQVGWRVTVLERAVSFGEIGAGITLLSNGLRCLDAIGLGDAVRGSGLPLLATGMRTAGGRWLSRIDGDGTDLQARIGTTTLSIHRAELHKILHDALPGHALIANVTTTGIQGGADGGPVEVHYRHGDRDAMLRADLVVGADGVHSWVRAQRWPDAPAPVYSGSTTWRAVTTPSSAAVTEMSLSWGRGTEFGVMPLVDGRTYWYAAATAGEGQRNPDELGELRRRFGAWHEPIPAVLAHTQPHAVLRHDIYRLPKLDSYRRGSVVLLGDAAHAMTPNLGQGGGQALEDAITLAAALSSTRDVATALAGYDRERRARTQAMSLAAARQLRFGQQLRNPVAVAIRNTAVALTPDRIALLAIARYGKWRPAPLEEMTMRRKKPAMIQPRKSRRLETRLGPLAWQSSGEGPSLVFFAGALANHDLWRDVVAPLEDRYRCITIDLPLGAHPWPLDETADRSAGSLARLLLDCVELLDIDDATVIANDTAGGLLLLSLASGHEALSRIGRLVLTNCETYQHFPPDALKAAARMCRLAPWLATEGIRIQARRQLRSPKAQRKGMSAVAATHVDPERMASFAGPGQRDRRVIGDFVALLASCHPELLLTAAREIRRFERPVLLVWGDDDSRFFPLAHAERLAADFPHATLVPVPGARTWVPIDNPSATARAIAGFVPAQPA